VVKRREAAEAKQAGLLAAGLLKEKKVRRQWPIDPAIIIILLVFIAGLGTAFFAGTMGVEECKVVVKEQKRQQTQKRIEALQKKTRERNAATEAASEAKQLERSQRTGTENFNSIFSAGNLQQQPAEVEKQQTPRTGTENFNSIFSSGNLQQQSGQQEKPETRTGTENFNNVFDAGNLQQQSGQNNPNENSGQ